MEGLHLINFNLCEIKADILAICEYNRLRRLYMDDLPQLNIPTPNAFSIADNNLRALPKQNLEVQQNQTLEPDIYDVHGLSNNNNVSSYANSLIQSLFHLKLIRLTLNSSNMDIMHNLYKQYRSKENINILEFRKTIDTNFSMNNEEDPQTFLSIIFSQSNCIHNSIQFKISTICKCTICDYREEDIKTQYVLKLRLPDNYKETHLTLQEIIDYNLDWKNINDDCKAVNCSSKQLLHKINDTINNSIIV